MAFLTLNDIQGVSNKLSASDLQKLWKDQVQKNRANWQVASSVRLPSVIRSPKDLATIVSFSTKPNFISSGIVEGMIIVLEKAFPDDPSIIQDKIVVIEAADPGYDWIFAVGILGLVTMFGGAASHMAFRCSELGIPAAIGIGNSLFQKVRHANKVRVDCIRKELIILE